MLIVDFVPEALRSDCVAARIKVPTKFWKTQLIIVRGCVWLHLPTPSLGRKRLHLAYTMRSESALHKKICTEHIRFICVLYLRQNRLADQTDMLSTYLLMQRIFWSHCATFTIINSHINMVYCLWEHLSTNILKTFSKQYEHYREISLTALVAADLVRLHKICSAEVYLHRRTQTDTTQPRFSVSYKE